MTRSTGSGQGAARALTAAAVAALRATGRFASVDEGAPIQASLPSAIVETGPEADWGHKSGAGRQVRLAVRVTAAGEHGGAIAVLADAAEAAVLGTGVVAGWQVVTLAMERSRTVRDDKRRWTQVVEFRARMLAG